MDFTQETVVLIQIKKEEESGQDDSSKFEWMKTDVEDTTGVNQWGLATDWMYVVRTREKSKSLLYESGYVCEYWEKEGRHKWNIGVGEAKGEFHF